MRCTICDVPLSPSQRLEDDLCSTCHGEVRKARNEMAVGLLDPLDTPFFWEGPGWRAMR